MYQPVRKYPGGSPQNEFLGEPTWVLSSCIKTTHTWGAWPAQLEEHVTFDLSHEFDPNTGCRKNFKINKTCLTHNENKLRQNICSVDDDQLVIFICEIHHN